MTRLNHILFWITASAVAARGATVQTLDGRLIEGDARLDRSGLVVQPPSGESISIALTNVLSAKLAAGPFLSGGNALPHGWSSLDIGETRGFSRLDADSFTVRVESRSTNHGTLHLIHRPMPSDGEIMARVDALGATGKTARAGVMMRTETQSSAAYASVAWGSDGRVWFERRPEKDRKEVRTTAGPSVPLPVWLRLQKQEKRLTAFYSADGNTWNVIGSDEVRFPIDRRWREHQGEVSVLRAVFGLFAAERSRGACTAAVAAVSMNVHGLLGEYFADQSMTKLMFMRIDPQIKFGWGRGSPDPSIDNDHFSVRWTGKLVPGRSEPQAFYFDADDRARLWVGGQEIPQARFDRNAHRTAREIPLVPGKPVDLRMDFEESDGSASVRLEWGPKGKPPQVIASTNFLVSFTGTNAPEVAAATNHGLVTGVLLRNGTFLAGAVQAADEVSVRLSFSGQAERSILNSRVARIILRAPNQPIDFRVAAGRSGVYLKNGDFFESEFRGIQHGSLQMSSLLFGPRRYGLAGGDAVAVVFHDCHPPSAPIEVRLIDGSSVRAVAIGAADGALEVKDEALGLLRFSSADLLEIRNVAAESARARRRLPGR